MPRHMLRRSVSPELLESLEFLVAKRRAPTSRLHDVLLRSTQRQSQLYLDQDGSTDKRDPVSVYWQVPRLVAMQQPNTYLVSSLVFFAKEAQGSAPEFPLIITAGKEYWLQLIQHTQSLYYHLHHLTLLILRAGCTRCSPEPRSMLQ